MSYSVVIYGLMIVGIASSLYFFYKLIMAGRDLQNAVKKIATKDEGLYMKNSIKAGSSVKDELFANAQLRGKFALFEDEIADTSQTGDGFTDCDIEFFINEDLMNEIGGRGWCDFVSTGLTALGILGTFLGLKGGMKDFNLNDTKVIVDTITQMISGMKFAFTTSIWGIGLAIVFGFFVHLLNAWAMKQLNAFLDTFHRNVMDSETDNAFNTIIAHISGLNGFSKKVSDSMSKAVDDQTAALDKTCTRMLSTQAAMMQQVSDHFFEMMSSKLTPHFDELGKSVDEVSAAYRGFSRELGNVQGELSTASQTVRTMTTTLENCIRDTESVSRRFENLLTDVDTAQQRSHDLAQRSVDHMTESYDTHAKALTQTMDDMLRTQTSAVDTLTRQQKDALDQANAQQQATFSKVTAEQKDAITKACEEQSRAITTATEQQRAAITKNYEQQRGMMEESAQLQSSMLEEQKNAAAELNRAAKEMSDRAVDALAATKAQMQSVEEMQTRVKEMTELVDAKLEEIRKKTGKGLFGFMKK